MSIAKVQERRDVPTVDAMGRPREVAIDGARLERLVPYSDHRGDLTQIMNSVSPIWKEPVAHSYHVTVRPGRIKGWGMHRFQSDRHYSFSGEGRMVLYDGREESPTHGEVAQVGFSDVARGVLYIPPGVWHAAQNTGTVDWHLINFPTRPYDYESPDKFRIDPHSGEIPFDFELRDR
jgi:dTDP-4-dehydrorhamnose 3,5-epimerase